jgi:hypothetical protein
MNQEYKSFLHGGQTNATPMGAPSFSAHKRGLSMLPSMMASPPNGIASNIGVVREIEV